MKKLLLVRMRERQMKPTWARLNTPAVLKLPPDGKGGDFDRDVGFYFSLALVLPTLLVIKSKGAGSSS